ncbi:hypothetical protein AVEN_8994-1 [Araneus ventricosus]|uniref:Uncharacterized protein n=1 Tax=Araneus ventricosus TaxID=182803 RepID=A0A4Y2DSV7_ARAVE|nr:hypothetical protein AVEN_8994-1 [Araneus ventricosus]
MCYHLCSKLVLQSWCEACHNNFIENLFCKWIGRLCFVTLQEFCCKVATSSLSWQANIKKNQTFCKCTCYLGRSGVIGGEVPVYSFVSFRFETQFCAAMIHSKSAMEEQMFYHWSRAEAWSCSKDSDCSAVVHVV